MSEMINLDGQFKVDLYNQHDELIESTDFQKNFITTTGLSYPYTMPFADGFRWLSLGTSNTANTINTTGLGAWIDAKDYNEPYSDRFSYLTGYITDGCGYQETASGVDLYRAWRVPDIPMTGLMKKDLTFKELMVSPGRPEKSGVIGDSPVLYTGGALQKSPTDGLSAFSRVLQEFTIPSGDYAVITYKLGITIDTGIRNFNKFIGLYEADSTYGSPDIWQNLTGKSRILHAGIRVVKGGKSPNGGGNGGDGEGPGDGSTVLIDSVGGPMEPYESGSALKAYWTTDDTHFLFNQYWGGKLYTGAYKPWNSSDGAEFGDSYGFPAFFHNIYTLGEKDDSNQGGMGGGDNSPKSKDDLITGSDRYDKWITYRSADFATKASLPKTGDYTDSIDAGPLAQGGYSWNGVVVNSWEHETTIFKGSEDFTKRTRDITRVCSWQAKNAKQDSVKHPTSQQYEWIRYRSLVFGYKNPNANNAPFIPFFDSLFGTFKYCDDDNPASITEKLCCTNNNGTWANDACSNGTKTWGGGGNYLPSFTTPQDASHTDFTYTGAKGNYPFQDGQNGLNITWKLTWAAPCGGVSNCTDP